MRDRMPQRAAAAIVMIAALAAEVGSMPNAVAAEAALQFFAQGDLVSLAIGGEDVLREQGDRAGFFTVMFDGLQTHVTPLRDVVVMDTEIRVTGPNGLPRLTLALQPGDRHLTIRLVRAEGMPRGRDAGILCRAATRRPVFARATDPRVLVDSKPDVIAAYWTRLGDSPALAGEPGIVLDLEAPSAGAEKPDRRPDRSGKGLPLPFTTVGTRGDGRFMLLQFDGRGIHPEQLHVLAWDGASLVVGLPDAEEPRFTFRVTENEHYLLIKLVEAAGDFSARDTSLIFESREDSPREVFRLDYIGRNGSGNGRVLLLWPHLWNPCRADPLGGFGIIRPQADDEARDRALAELWAEGTMPHPVTGRRWTAEEALSWIDAYHRKFAGLSETTLSAASRGELDSLTDWLHRVGIRRVYLHTDTWRHEYWPRERSFVDVNPAVFPGGRADVVAYSKQLHDRGMQLRLHSVSGGIGKRDPEFVLGSRVDPRLATWVRGRLETAIDDDATVLAFRPESDPNFPHLRLEPRVWNLNHFRIGAEVVSVGELADVDRAVWTLKRVTRGVDGTPRTAHDAKEDMAGLVSAYGQNYVPDNNSDLLAEMAARYARMINEAQLDHEHYDGAEIHRHLEPWGFDKFSYLVAGGLERAVTSSTSGGRPAPWNLELAFSGIRRLDELGYGALTVPVMLDGHRHATSWLDAHYGLASARLASARRLGFQKPEPMFGVSEEIRSRHGLMPRFEQLVDAWRHVLSEGNDPDIAYLRTLLTPITLQLGRSGHHHQALDVPVLEHTPAGLAFVPTRVLVREGIDAPWIVGQEFGPYGPRQYLQPGETIELWNPHSPQEPKVVVRVLPALSLQNGEPATSAAQARDDDSRLADYRTGADAAGKATLPEAMNAAPESLWPSPQAIRPGGATSLEQTDDGILLTAANPTDRDLWETEALPTWGCRVPLRGRRGLLLKIDGDGSGAVLVVQLHGAGVRDYVVKLDFTGPRRIIIPNGEVAWAAGWWGWRKGSKHFNYDGEVRAVSLGFGHLPAKTSSRILVRRLVLLDNAPGILRDPVVRVGEGQVGIRGEVHEDEYLTIDVEHGARVFDRNWNLLRPLDSTRERFTAPEGAVAVRVDAEADGENPPPWLELQVITRGKPHLIKATGSNDGSR